MTNSQKFTKERVIDPTPADNGEYRIQSDWIDFFNKEGKAMISAPDVYRAPDSILPDLIKDFNEHWLITGTRVIYNKGDLGARIIHNFGSTVVNPIGSSLIVPEYLNEQVEKVAKGEGLTYLQTLFQTEDNAYNLIGRLERISGKEAKEIRISTPGQISRLLNRPERVVDFMSSENFCKFLVNSIGEGIGRIYTSSGPSRGVSVKFACVIKGCSIEYGE